MTNKKKLKIILLSLMVILLFSAKLLAQINNFDYTGYARDCNCELMIGVSTLTIEISIIEESLNGTIRYKETHPITSNSWGAYTVTVGAGTVISGSMSSVDCSVENFIKVIVDNNEAVVQNFQCTAGVVTIAQGFDAAEIPGTVRYFLGGEKIQFYNGTSWVNICCKDDCNWVPTITACGNVALVDYGGHIYHTVAIGEQCWLKENLNVGSFIQSTTQQSEQTPETIEKYCYGNNPANCDIYGGLYQWGEAVQYINDASNTSVWSPIPSRPIRGICPEGWHIPSFDEFEELEIFLDVNAGKKLQWSGNDCVGDGCTLDILGISYFDALLSGTKLGAGTGFANLLYSTHFVLSELGLSTPETHCQTISVGRNFVGITYGDNMFKDVGFSVRCLMN